MPNITLKDVSYRYKSSDKNAISNINLTFEEGKVTAVVGPSGSGKTTLANAVCELLKERDMPVQIIDGDILRSQLGNLFGYTRDERIRQSRVNRVLTGYLVQNGINVLIAVVAPYEEVRHGLREYLGKDYLEVYVKCPYEVCAARDVKGYYKLSAQNKIENLNGANDVYEPPQQAELTVRTDEMSQDLCAEAVIQLLEERGYGV